jgi:hypothetical protein
MIQRKPSKRLGHKGPSEVKNHPWLVDFPWEDLYNGKIKPKFVPKVFIFKYKCRIRMIILILRTLMKSGKTKTVIK